MKTLSFIVGLALLLAPAAGAAASDEAVDKARARFYRGVELYKEGSFEAALAEFQKAYELTPSYRVLYNIAQTYFELHDYANASRTLKAYVDQGGSELPTSRRAQVDELNRKLEKRVALLDITCNLDDAELNVDDVPIGRSPLPSPVLVNAGPRKVSAVRAGYAVATRMVTMTGGEQASIRLDLTPPIELLTSKPAPVPVVAPPRVAARAPAPEAAAKPPRRSRAALVGSLTVAGGCAVATGIFGWQMLLAKSDFDREAAKTPYDRPAIESARSRALTYQYLTDGFGAATLLATGVALYLVLADDTEPTPRKRSQTRRSLAVAPTAGGLSLHGVW